MNKNSDEIPVIDLFAGPGGLSEGFSSFSHNSQKTYPFKVGVSIEMDPYAHRTLELRSFFHEFPPASVPEEYYQYLRKEISREELFNSYPEQAIKARKKAVMATLGSEDDVRIHQRIKEVLTEYKDKPWVLIGGPPCQAYSLIGRSRRQAKGVGLVIQQQDKRNFLYLEYLRIIAKFHPSVFVMENVKGMLSAEINGERIVNKIFKDLRNPEDAITEKNISSKKSKLEYRIYSLVTSAESDEVLSPGDYLIRSEEFGIPQARHRVILLGIRSDLNIKPDTLKPKQRKVTVRELLSDLPALRSFFTKTKDSEQEWLAFIKSIIYQDWFKDYKPLIRNGRKLEPDRLMTQIANGLSRLKPLGIGSEFIKTRVNPRYNREWFFDKRIGGVINHSARGHMKEDLWRYFFSSIYAEIYGCSPKMKDFPKQLLPNHRNVQTQEAIERGDFGDRFRVQDANHPAVTITCHISKDGHYSIHYDPAQCRSLTVREAARLQTFPDNYYFEGPRTQQYHQVGNAVPPLLAVQIAKVVFDVIKKTK